jgi:hypothetical protein
MKIPRSGAVIALFIVAFVSREVAPKTAADPGQARGLSAAEDRQRLMELLRLPMPGPFLPAAEDPNRPQFTKQRSGGNNWYDEAGNLYVRSNWGETVDNVAGAGEYHWMAGNFLKYGGRWNDLPVDPHELIALCAPRPVFITGGTRDQWSDPRGEFLACAGAGPVYRLLGKKDLGVKEMPAPDVDVVAGDLGFRLHEGGHTHAPDWPVFLKFARRYLGEQPAASPGKK